MPSHYFSKRSATPNQAKERWVFMPADMHKKNFDEGTLIKLDILRQYLRKWLPVFIKDHNRTWPKLAIYDLFAGAGSDIDGIPGSPLIILDELKLYCDEIDKRKMTVLVILNEAKKRKAKQLSECCTTTLEICKQVSGSDYYCPSKNEPNCCFKLLHADDDFQDLFQVLQPQFKEFTSAPQFMFLDQYGIKHVTKEIFSQIVCLERTDFLFFISSSFIARFIDLPEFAAYIALTRADFVETDSLHCHRVICDYYRSLVPDGVEYYIAPFSIKKGKNVYGLIFGSHNLLGLRKFLECAWDTDPNTGEANFNIDNDHIVATQQLSLFEAENVVKKLDYYQNEITSWLQVAERTNFDIYKYSLLHGFLPKHTNDILREMEKNGVLEITTKGSDKRRTGAFYLSEDTIRITIQHRE